VLLLLLLLLLLPGTGDFAGTAEPPLEVPSSSALSSPASAYQGSDICELSIRLPRIHDQTF
jgi:hypothetical protein